MDADRQKRVENFSFISQLLDRGKKQLDRIFLERWGIFCNLNKNVNQWKNDSSSGKELFPLCNSLTKPQKLLVKDGNIHVWDISLLFLTINAVSKEIQNLGSSVDAVENSLVKSLKDQRNKHAHGSSELTDDVFEDDWKNIKNILIKLGDDPKDIDAIKTKNLEPKPNKIKSDFSKLKNKLNKCLKGQKYNQACEINDQMYDLPDLSHENFAYIYAKRSEIFLLILNNEDEASYERSKIFAEIAIKLYPEWWEGYFRMAKAQIKCREFGQAAINLEIAAELNPQSTEIKDELLYVQREIAMRSYLRKGIERRSRKYETEIDEAAKNGSDTANRVRSIWWYMDCATDALENKNHEMFIFLLSKAMQLDFHNLVAEYSNQFRPTVNEFIEGRENDLDAVICYTKLNWGIPGFENILMKFVKTNLSNIEICVALAQIFIILYGQEKDALMNIEKMLIDLPNSFHLLYYRIFALCEQKELSPNIVTAIDDFLKIAPEDHEKVPDCIYRKAKYYYTNGNMELFSKYFIAAFEAEKKQLPCFLPYKSKDKDFTENIFNVFVKEVKFEDTTPKLVSISLAKQAFIIQHRRAFINAENTSNSNKCIFPKQKPHTFEFPKFANPLQISLKNMNFSAENYYHGYFLKAKLIDWSFASMDTIFTVIEDDNGDIQRLAVQKLPSKNCSDAAESLKTFYPNCTVIIMFPDVRRAINGEIMICLENMDSIKIVNELNDKKCFTCGALAKVLKCSKCLLSHYCSKECQKIDWIELKHKDVCGLLKKYSAKINNL